MCASCACPRDYLKSSTIEYYNHRVVPRKFRPWTSTIPDSGVAVQKPECAHLWYIIVMCFVFPNSTQKTIITRSTTWGYRAQLACDMQSKSSLHGGPCWFGMHTSVLELCEPYEPCGRDGGATGLYTSLLPHLRGKSAVVFCTWTGCLHTVRSVMRCWSWKLCSLINVMCRGRMYDGASHACNRREQPLPCISVEACWQRKLRVAGINTENFVPRKMHAFKPWVCLIE